MRCDICWKDTFNLEPMKMCIMSFMVCGDCYNEGQTIFLDWVRMRRYGREWVLTNGLGCGTMVETGKALVKE